MFFTVFTYESSDTPHCIIHKQEAKPYAKNLAQYPEYFTVERKPTLAEANTIFSVCKPSTLCARFGNGAKTEKLK